ncbi:MAG: IS200/IS605 family transposase [Verrucomicrobiota bacterium]
MPQSLDQVLLHVVFSTKNRERWLEDELRDEMHAVFGGVAEGLGATLLKAGSVEDHVHLLFVLPRTVTIADLVMNLKTGSAKWLKGRSTHFGGFRWQAGYGVFSIGASQREDLERYFARQKEHHQKVSFQEEYRKFLDRYRVSYDERYVWD